MRETNAADVLARARTLDLDVAHVRFNALRTSDGVLHTQLRALCSGVPRTSTPGTPPARRGPFEDLVLTLAELAEAKTCACAPLLSTRGHWSLLEDLGNALEVLTRTRAHRSAPVPDATAPQQLLEHLVERRDVLSELEGRFLGLPKVLKDAVRRERREVRRVAPPHLPEELLVPALLGVHARQGMLPPANPDLPVLLVREQIEEGGLLGWLKERAVLAAGDGPRARQLMLLPSAALGFFGPDGSDVLELPEGLLTTERDVVSALFRDDPLRPLHELLELSRALA